MRKGAVVVEPKAIWAFVVALLLVAIPVIAQLPVGTILGTVKDATGAVIPGAMVTITNTETGLMRTLITDSDGTYREPELPVGNYSVKAEHMGFKTVIRTGITLNVSELARIDFSLEVGATTQAVIVTGEAPLVDTSSATLGGLVNENYMNDLPVNGRNYINLDLTIPGVTQFKNQSTGPGGRAGATATSEVSFSVNGAPPRSNLFTLDGAITTTQEGLGPTNAAAGSTLGMDGIREMNVITSDPAAEYGMAMGSQVVLVSKSGTNQFHGDAFDYLRNNHIAARDFFAITNPPLRKNQYGGALGGPIKKDKTFFFATFEGLGEALGQTTNDQVLSAGCHAPAGATVQSTNPSGANYCPDIGVGVVPSVVVSQAAGEVLPLDPLPNQGPNNFIENTSTIINEKYGQMRVDENLSSSDTLFVRYTIDDALQVAPNPVVIQNTTQQPDRNQSVTLGWNHIFTPTLLNTFRFSYSRTDVITVGHDLIPGPSLNPGEPTGVIAIGGTNAGSSYTEFDSGPTVPTRDMQGIYTISDDINWTVGKHSFKFGTLLNRFNEKVVNEAGIDGQLTYPTVAGFFLSEPNLAEVIAPGSVGNRFSVFDTVGLYGQDAWRASQRLTVNYGLRWEFATPPHETAGIQSRLINDLTSPSFTVGPVIAQHELRDFSPRVGIAYDLFGNGKTALRAGAGIYYDIANIGAALEQDVIGSPPFSGLIDVTGGSVPNIASFYPVPFPLPAGILNAPPSAITPQYIDYNWQGTYMVQWNASVEQQLPWDMGLTVGYVGNHGVHLPTIRDANPILPTSTVPCSSDITGDCVSSSRLAPGTGNVVDLWDSATMNYANINQPSNINIATVSESDYHAFEIALTKRTSHGLQFQTSYVRSQVYDDTQGQENVRDCSVGAGIQGTDTLHPRQVDWGPACFNTPNNWQFDMVYHFPTIGKGNKFLKGVANGWWIGSVASIQSGEPIDVVLNNNRSNLIDQVQQDRANINTAASIAAFPCNATNPCAYTPVPFNASTATNLQIKYQPGQIATVQFFTNPAMFSMSPETLSPASEQANPGPNCFNGPGACTVGQLGNSPRDFLQGPNAHDWDFSLVKDTKVGWLGEAGKVEFRCEVFNILNHPDFGSPNTGIFNGAPNPGEPVTGDLGPFSEAPLNTTFGKITTQINNPRQIQFALRIEF